MLCILEEVKVRVFILMKIKDGMILFGRLCHNSKYMVPLYAIVMYIMIVVSYFIVGWVSWVLVELLSSIVGPVGVLFLAIPAIFSALFEYRKLKKFYKITILRRICIYIGVILIALVVYFLDPEPIVFYIQLLLFMIPCTLIILFYTILHIIQKKRLKKSSN
jgi:hypothetical protein